MARRFVSEIADQKGIAGVESTSDHVLTLAPEYYSFMLNNTMQHEKIDTIFNEKADKSIVPDAYQPKMYYRSTNGCPFYNTLANIDIPNVTTAMSDAIPLKDVTNEQLYLPYETYFSGTVYVMRVNNGTRARTGLSVLANGVEIAYQPDIPVNAEHSNTTLWCPVSYYNGTNTGHALSVKFHIDPGAELDAQSNVEVQIRGCLMAGHIINL